MKTVIIVEGNKVDDKTLSANLREYKDLQLIGCYTNTLKIYENIINLKPDLAFLNLDLNKDGGLLFFNKIISESPDTKVVLISEKRSSATLAYEYGAFDYLLKPINKDRLDKTIKRAFREE